MYNAKILVYLYNNIHWIISYWKLYRLVAVFTLVRVPYKYRTKCISYKIMSTMHTNGVRGTCLLTRLNELRWKEYIYINMNRSEGIYRKCLLDWHVKVTKYKVQSTECLAKLYIWRKIWYFCALHVYNKLLAQLFHYRILAVVLFLFQFLDYIL